LSAFDDLVAGLLEELFALQPELATAIGDHRYDDQWSDMSEAGRRARLAFADHWDDVLSRVDPGTLSSDEQIDLDLLRGELAALRFSEAELIEEAWSPLAWVYLLGGGLHPLLAREYAPLAVRLASVLGRLEGIPRLVGQARAVMGTHPTRAVARLHAEAAAQRIGGISALARDALAQAEAAAGDDREVAILLPELKRAADEAVAAIDAMARHLAEEVAPGVSGPAELGEPLYTRKLRHTLRDPEASAADVLARAEAEYVAVRGEMVRIAREIWPRWRSGEAMPDDEGDLVRGTLDAIAAEHPGANDLVAACTEELARIEAFCRDRGIIGLAEEPLRIDWTPEFMRSFAGAMLDSPGPLDAGQRAFFSITPVRDEWSPDEVESYLREMNSRQLKLLTIHEAVPGHYLQGAHGNRGASLARRVFGSGLFAEGWAVYVTQVMLDRGYADDDLALWLVHWKFYLRAVINTILDVRIHTMGMTSEEAIALMVQGGFQERAEALAKDERARLSSTQLVTYFLGSVGMWEIEDAARRRAAIAVGAGEEAVPAPTVVGGYPATPGFDERAHLEAIIANGEPPMPLLRRIMLGDR
jgi:hypothetical protein